MEDTKKKQEKKWKIRSKLPIVIIHSRIDSHRWFCCVCVIDQLANNVRKILFAHKTVEQRQSALTNGNIVVVEASQNQVAMFGNSFGMNCHDVAKSNQAEILEILIAVFNKQTKLCQTQTHNWNMLKI